MALGRAIVREPAVFLMDEPLSNLDAKLRVQTRAEIARLHQRLRTTTVYVTHDQVEAMTMGTRIAIMNHGVLQQVGTPQQVYDNPTNLFVAGFIGSPAMNLVRMTASADGLDGGGLHFPVPERFRAAVGASPSVVAGFRPDHLNLGSSAGGAVIKGVADVVEYLGSEELLHVSVPGFEGDLLASVGAEHRVQARDTVELTVSLDKLHLFDAESGQTLAA